MDAEIYGGVAQLGEHLPCKQGVRGSNPLISTVPQHKMRGTKPATHEPGGSSDRMQARDMTEKTHMLTKASFWGIRNFPIMPDVP